MTHANFLYTTQRFEDQIGDATSFIWASYCGLWKIYGEARRLNDALGISNWKDAENYLLGDVPRDGGVDMKEIAITRSWEQHELSFEQLMLIQMSVLYEEWSMKFCAVIDPALLRISDVLQFPSSSPRSNLPKGHPKTWVLWQAQIDASPSVLIRDDYRPSLLARYPTVPAVIDALLSWYRFFKECRNAFVHGGGHHTAISVSAYVDAASTPLTSLGLKRDLNLTAVPVVGDPVQMGMKNASLGFGVVARLANAFDAALCHSQGAEAYLIASLRAKATAQTAAGRQVSIPSAKPHLREKAVKSLLRAALLPQPSKIAETDALLLHEGIFKV